MSDLSADTFIAALILSGVLSIAITISAWRRRQAPGTTAFAIMMSAVAVWAFGYAIQLASSSLPAKIFWNNIVYLGIVSIPVLWLVFSLSYTGETQLTRRKYIIRLFLLPAVTTLLIWSNPWHGAFWNQVQLETAGALTTIASQRGIWFWVHAGYSYACLMVGTFYLIRLMINDRSQLYRRQVLALLIAVLAPWLGNALFIFNFSPLQVIDPTPFAFTITGLALALGIFRYRLLDILPAAHDAVLDSMTDGVIVLDAQNRILEINPAARQFVRLANPSQEVKPGQSALEVFAIWPEALQRFQDTVRAFATEVPFRVGKRTHYIDVRISPLLDENSKMVGRVLVTSDVTSRKLSADLEQARKKAEAASQAKSAFFASMSHELRTPLNHIIGYSEMLMDDVAENQHQDLYLADLQKVHGAGQHLLSIISQILELAKLEAGKITAQPETFSLQDLLNDLALHIQPAMVGQQNQFFLDVPEQPIQMYSDPHKLRQALLYLLDNAAQFTQAGKVSLTTRQTGRDVLIEVSDTGSGIPEAMLNDLFGAFANQDSHARTPNQGLGLGLATAQQLSFLLGGEIRVKSQVGLGSTFSLNLPLEMTANRSHAKSR